MVVVIPVFNRPEFLTVTLDLISKSEGSSKNTYIFCLDHGFKTSNIKVINNFRGRGFKCIVKKTPFRSLSLGKQSYNVLTGYKLAYDTPDQDGLICLIEDDIFISNDFFRWHAAIHSKEGRIFCSIATRNNNRNVKTEDDLNLYYLTHLDYQSLGVCFNRDALGIVLKHYTFDYFNDPISYLEKHFPKSSIGKYYAEQDGLIRRIQEVTDYKIAFPHVPRAFHAGFYGKNRGVKMVGTFAEKVRFIYENCFTPDGMKRLAANDNFYEDSIPVNLVNYWGGVLECR